MQLDELDFVGDLARLPHTHQQMQVKTSAEVVASRELRKMSSSVVNRLSELKKLINLSKRLLDKYDNTELNIVLMEASMKNHKNVQAVVNMQLQREDNIRNLSTLQFGLQNILPSLVKSANSILLSASQYAFILQSNLMQEAENLVHKCINDCWTIKSVRQVTTSEVSVKPVQLVKGVPVNRGRVAEQAVGEENLRELYDAIKKRSGRYGKPDIPVKGKMAINHLGSKSFLKEFLNRPVPLSPLNIEATQANLLMDYIVPILEISKAIQKTKNVKATGPNSMSAEALKSDMGTEKDNISIQPGCNIPPAELIIRVDKLKSLLYEKKRCRTHRIYEVPSVFKWEEESTCSDKNNLPHQESPVMSVSSHLSNSDIDIQPCQTISTGNVIKNSLSPYPEMKIIYRESDYQQEKKLCRISSGDDIRYINVKEQPSTSKLCVNDDFPDKPTHRITHDFSSKNKNVLILSKGQLVTIIRSYGQNGNTNWSLVKFHPCGEIKFVPTNYLEAI
ncbi:unnamed protein product [Schistosoma margrebowiei]|uniref:Uncharacterized protein n=1 Tax=Schistosoma margrebowiei TaxID=48269 RepID=A0A183MVU7_9TREM|nr:unnamed protein product [Schistosoma margrebowiei]